MGVDAHLLITLIRGMLIRFCSGIWDAIVSGWCALDLRVNVNVACLICPLKNLDASLTVLMVVYCYGMDMNKIRKESVQWDMTPLDLYFIGGSRSLRQAWNLWLVSILQ